MRVIKNAFWHVVVAYRPFRRNHHHQKEQQ